jgi:hypothetical protein
LPTLNGRLDVTRYARLISHPPTNASSPRFMLLTNFLARTTGSSGMQSALRQEFRDLSRRLGGHYTLPLFAAIYR